MLFKYIWSDFVSKIKTCVNLIKGAEFSSLKNQDFGPVVHVLHHKFMCNVFFPNKKNVTKLQNFIYLSNGMSWSRQVLEWCGSHQFVLYKGVFVFCIFMLFLVPLTSLEICSRR